MLLYSKQYLLKFVSEGTFFLKIVSPAFSIVRAEQFNGLMEEVANKEERKRESTKQRRIKKEN
jgi:hypothetical protein